MRPHVNMSTSCRHVNISPCLWVQLVNEVPAEIWIRDKFKLKIDRSGKTPWQEYGVVAGSKWWAPDLGQLQVDKWRGEALLFLDLPQVALCWSFAIPIHRAEPEGNLPATKSQTLMFAGYIQGKFLSAIHNNFFSSQGRILERIFWKSIPFLAVCLG